LEQVFSIIGHMPFMLRTSFSIIFLHTFLLFIFNGWAIYFSTRFIFQCYLFSLHFNMLLLISVLNSSTSLFSLMGFVFLLFVMQFLRVFVFCHRHMYIDVAGVLICFGNMNNNTSVFLIVYGSCSLPNFIIPSSLEHFKNVF
ncbi:hypothetical protein ACJX0J_041835, partial [Zea mays]